MSAGAALSLVGARRAGKSTLAYQIIKDLLKLERCRKHFHIFLDEIHIPHYWVPAVKTLTQCQEKHEDCARRFNIHPSSERNKHEALWNVLSHHSLTDLICGILKLRPCPNARS
ncbi:MAG: hypothetical protein C5S49_02370 [Candidatus Methanogaster sp.]|nr:MAG: hypothetical protein C5S49_02370 [ANME-2 cluster archaeon]